MPTGKRASMREGPLAALFRKSDEESEAAEHAGEPEGAATPAAKPDDSATVRARADASPAEGADLATPSPHVEARPGLPPHASAADEAAVPAPGRGLGAREHDPEPPGERVGPPEPAPQRRAPSPQERLRHVFSADIPYNMLDRRPGAASAPVPATPETGGAAPPPVEAAPPPVEAAPPPVEAAPPPVEAAPPPLVQAEPTAPSPRAAVADVYARPDHISAAYTAPVPLGKPVLRVVGVGGAGVNAVNRMIEAEIAGVEFVAINTDLQSLQQSAADQTLHIGERLTRGLGTGSDPELGRQAARDEYDRIKAMLRGSDMVFIAAGAGGGTGTGAAPVVAQIARELGALTVAILTRPFHFEGSRRLAQAEGGIAAMETEVDTLIVVPNNRLLSVLHRNISMVDAFRVADDVLRQGVQGIADLVTLPGLINLDFADVRTIMSGAGTSLLGIGMGSGERRAIDAAEAAVASPLLDTSMEGARSILLSITGSSDLSLWEVNEAAKAVSAAAHPDANIIFGAMIDDNLEDNVWVTVVATGYGEGKVRRREQDRSRPGERSALREPWTQPRLSPARRSDPEPDFDIPEFIPRR